MEVEVPLACSSGTLWGGAGRLGSLACLSSTHRSHMAAARWFGLVLRASPGSEEGRRPLLRSFSDVNLFHTSSYHLWWSAPSGRESSAHSCDVNVLHISTRSPTPCICSSVSTSCAPKPPHTDTAPLTPFYLPPCHWSKPCDLCLSSLVHAPL